jgi:serine/threonine-protein kinase
MKDGTDPSALELFNQEWRTLANVAHPNIVDVLNSGEFEDDGQRKPYFVMPLLPGKTLDKLIRDSGHKLTVDRVVEILAQTCRGLQAAHTSGLIHRDLKPSNLFVLNDDSVKIIDFGMVHLADVTKSATGIKGTLQYMSPEQLELKEVTSATDIFSLGVVAYEALTGRKPFDRGSERAVAEAIRREFPPAVSDLNPAVNQPLAQVIAKAMAKNPWNRFANAREFADSLHRAAKGEVIEGFEAARIQPRIERVRKALAEGDFEFADEILNELQLEGHVDPEITLLVEQVKEAARARSVRLLLENARTRLKEEEFPLAWQKIQEALQRDPGNTEALALQAEIDTRRKDQQVEKWRRLVQQHLHNHAFTQARHAIEEIRKIGPDDPQIRGLEQLADEQQKKYKKACDSKEQHFQSAMRAYNSGEISTALSKLEKILELDTRTPGFSFPGRDEVYRETYNKIRSEWEAVQHAVAEIERVIATGDLARAAEVANEQSAECPNDLEIQALKLKIEDLLRQEKSAYIAETTRRVEAEPDLDRCVKYLEEAIERYPKEPHFEDLASNLRKRRDLVNPIIARARQYEEQNMPHEALGQWSIVRSIHPKYPGLEFEIERVERRCEQQKKEEARLNWVNQIDGLLQSNEYERTLELAGEALEQFPGDQELQTLKRLAQEGCQRSSEAIRLVDVANDLASEGRHEDALETLRKAAALDPSNATIRARLADVLVAQAQPLISSDWRTAEKLVQEAMYLAPEHALAKSLRPSILLAKRTEYVEQCVSQARELQAASDISGALAKVHEGLTAYPNDGRLVQLQNTLKRTLNDQARTRRTRDLEELRQLSQQVKQTYDQTSLTALLERSVVLTKLYPDDQEVHKVASDIQQGAARNRTMGTPKPVVSSGAGGAAPAQARIAEPAEPVRELAPAAKTEPAVAIVQRARAAASLAIGSAREFVTSRVGPASRLPGWQRMALFTAPVLVIALIVVVIGKWGGHRPPPRLNPPATWAVTFTTNVDGAAISVNGSPVQGGRKSLPPGAYQVTASKLGYKTVTQTLTVGAQPLQVPLTLEPEPQAIRVFTDLRAGKAFLDGVESVLQDGNFAAELAPGSVHTLKLTEGKTEVLSLEFDGAAGSIPRLVKPATTRDLPVAIVTSLGNKAMVQSTVPGAKAGIKGAEAQAIPAEGLQIALQSGDAEITIDAGNQPVTVPIDIGNGPVLTIKAGVANKGTIVVEANVDEADVYINGRKSSRRLQHGRWTNQFEPAEYQVRVALSGYEDRPAQKVAVVAGKRTDPVRFELTPVVTDAFFKVEGGTPGAEIILDGASRGTLDSTGAFGPIKVPPDVEHSIRFQKENFEPSATVRHAGAKETIQISGAEARLTAFGTLVLEVQPTDSIVTITRKGESAARKITETTLHLREGVYVVHAAPADPSHYNSAEEEKQVLSGQTVKLPLTLSRKVERVSLPPKPVELTDLFDASLQKWRKDSKGFWLREGNTWFKQNYFDHVFEVLKMKKRFGGQEKIHWLTYLDSEDYWEFEIDGTNLSWREVKNGKSPSWSRRPHYVGQSDSFKLEINVKPEGWSVKVGQAESLVQCKINGRTGFDSKIGLRLIK